MIEYYLYQVRASLILIFGWILSRRVVMLLSFVVKLGLFPFQTYLLKFARELEGIILTVALVLQKMVPLYIMLLVFNQYEGLEQGVVISAFFRVLVGVFGGVTMISYRALLAYSSLVYRGWIVLILVLNVSAFVYYFLVYLLFFVIVGISYNSSIVRLVN